MPVPTSYTDAWKLTIRINFNNIGVEGTKGKSLGWSETYYMPFVGTISDLTIVPSIANAKKLIAARAALLGGNCRIVRTTLSRLTQFRDRWPVGPVQDYPLTTFGDLQDPDFGYVNDINQALLFRFENGSSRFTHLVRGVRDDWTDDETIWADQLRPSFGPFNTVAVPGLTFDYGALPAVLEPPAAAGTAGEITFTVTSGVLSLPVITSPGGVGLKLQGLASGTFTGIVVRGYNTPVVGEPQPATLSITLTSGVITAVALDSAQGANTAYPSGTKYTLQPDNDGVMLQNYLYDQDYIRNFGSAVAQYCTFFSPGRVPKGSFSPSGTVARWPANSNIPVVDTSDGKTLISNGNGNMRFMVERVAARKTGRMYKDKRARKRVAR